MNDITIIWGPQGTGKTLVAHALLSLLPGAKRIVEEWLPCDRRDVLQGGDIACTQDAPTFNLPGARVLHVDAARALLESLRPNVRGEAGQTAPPALDTEPN